MVSVPGFEPNIPVKFSWFRPGVRIRRRTHDFHVTTHYSWRRLMAGRHQSDATRVEFLPAFCATFFSFWPDSRNFRRTASYKLFNLSGLEPLAQDLLAIWPFR